MRNYGALMIGMLACTILMAACEGGSQAEFGESCSSHSDCLSGLCLTLADSFCTQRCASDCDCPGSHSCQRTTGSDSVCAPGPSTCGRDAGGGEILDAGPTDAGPTDAGPPDGGTSVCTVADTGPLLPSGDVEFASLCVDFDARTCSRLTHNDCLDEAMPSLGNPVIFLRYRDTGEYRIAANIEYTNTSIDGVSHGEIIGRTAYDIPGETEVSFVASWSGGQYFVVVRFSGSTVTILRFERYTGG